MTTSSHMRPDRRFHPDSFHTYLSARDLAERLHTIHFFLCEQDVFLANLHLNDALKECGIVSQRLEDLRLELNAERAA